MRTNISTFIFLAFLFSWNACGDTATETSSADSAMEEADSMDATEETESTMATFVHSVFFYLREDITETEKEAFVDGVKSLGGIDVVNSFELGTPAGTPRDVVDGSYDYNLILRFDNTSDQNTYQDHPIHLKFVDDHSDKWTRVQVYDTILE